MLTTLLAADPKVPARDLLLDADIATERLARLIDAGRAWTGERVRAKYRIGESLRVVYRLSDGRRTILASARTFPDGGSAAVHARALELATPPLGATPGVVHDAEWGAVWWIFPNDRRLRDLASLIEPSPACRRRLGLDGWRRSEVVAYSPERSVTLRATSGGGDVRGYVKAYAPSTVDVAGLARRYDCVARHLWRSGDGSIASPSTLGHDSTTLALEPMPGTTWAASAPGDLPVLLELLGRAIAAIHDVTIDRELRATARFGRLLPPRVIHSAELVGRARPELAPSCGRLAAALAGGPDRGSTVLLHGDCHPNNALLDSERLSMVDLDQAGLGDPAADIGSLLARICHGVVLGEHDEATADALRGAFVGGYTTVRAMPPPSSVRWHTVAALVAERALRAVNRVQPAALATLADLLAAGEAEAAQL